MKGQLRGAREGGKEDNMFDTHIEMLRNRYVCNCRSNEIRSNSEILEAKSKKRILIGPFQITSNYKPLKDIKKVLQKRNTQRGH